MKFLLRFSQRNTLANAREIGVNQNRESVTEAAEGIEELLANPLNFSFSAVGQLAGFVAEKGGHLSGKEQHLFAKLVNYHLARLQNEGANSLRSRTLFAIFRRPGLSQFLSSQQRKSIEIFLSKERRELEKLAGTSVENWKPEDAIRVARSYRFIRNRLNTINLKIDEKTRNTGDNLKLYAAIVTEKPVLTNLDKLFLVELKRVFRDSGDWKDLAVQAKVFSQAEAVEKEFKDILRNGGDVPSDAQYYWDVLVPDTDEDSARDSNLNKFLTRSAQVESLQAILEKDKGGSEATRANVPLLLTIEEYQFLKTLSTQPPEGAIDTNGESQQAVAAAQGEKDTLMSAYTQLQQQREEEETTLKRQTPAQLKAHADLPTEQKNSFNEAWLNLDPSQPEAAEGETPTDVQTEFANYKTWRDTAIKEILNTSATLSEEAIAAKKAEADGLDAEIEEAQKLHEKLKERVAIYANPREQAQEVLTSHAKYFKVRLKAGRLLATDFDLITHLQPEEQTALLGNEAAQVTTLIDQTRAVVDTVLQTELQIPSLDQLSEQDLVKADKFLSYEQLIAHLAATKAAGETNDLLSALEARDSKIDVRQLLSAVVLDFRERIMVGITSQQTRNSQAYNKFLDHYARQHHAINKTDRVEKMLGFTNEMEKQKKAKVNDVYTHAYEKVSSLFANAEKEAILSGLNKILKTEINAQGVLLHIQQGIGEETLIHNGNSTDRIRWNKIITDELADKVTAENNDPAHLITIADDLLAKLDQMRAGEVAKAALQTGVTQIESTDEDNLAVSDRLELAKRSRLIFIEVREVNENFQAELTAIQAALEKGQSVDELVSSFIQAFDTNYFVRLEVLQKALVAEAQLLLGANAPFAKALEIQITRALNNLKSGVDSLKKTYQTPGETLDPSDEGFKMLIAAINNEVLPLFDIASGTVAKKEDVKLDSTLSEAAETHAFVRDDLGVLKPGGAEKARENYDKKLKEYEQTVQNFKEAWDETKKRLEKDLKKYNEEEFSGKHQMSKKQARKILADNDSRVTDADWMLGYFAGGEKDHNPFAGSREGVFDRWLTAYEDPAKQPQALSFMKNFKEFKNILGPDQENFAKETAEMSAFIKDFDNNKPTLWLKKKYKLSVSWYSLKSIYMMGKQFWEYWGKFTERKNDKMAAELGGKIFGNTRFGREFARDSNKKQDERVGDFKDVHKSSDYQQLFGIISKATNAERDKDEVQAALELLMEKGELRWDSADFLAMLGRLQDSIVFSLPGDLEEYAKNPAELRNKIGQAVTTIWDRPTWLQWKNDLPNKYDSQLKSHEKDYQEEIQRGGVDTYLQNMLTKWESGEIDPNMEITKYESYIYQAFDRGEMNGYPGGDRRWFYLIKGLTTRNPKGETILSSDVLSRFGALQGKMPFMDAFDSKEWKKNGRVVPDETAGAHEGSWNYEDIQAWGKYFDGIPYAEANSARANQATRKWLNESLLTTFDAQDRMGKVQLTDIDRDDAGILTLLVTPERLKQVLQFASGDKRPVDDKYYVNLLSSFENNFNDTINYLKESLSQDKEAPGYSDRREKQLLRFGQMLRSFFLMSHTMAGNNDFGSHVGAVVMSDAEWSNNGMGAIYDKINGKIVELTEKTEAKELIGMHNRKQEAAKVKGDDKVKRGVDITTAIYDDKIFTNIDRLELFLYSTDLV